MYDIYDADKKSTKGINSKDFRGKNKKVETLLWGGDILFSSVSLLSEIMFSNDVHLQVSSLDIVFIELIYQLLASFAC